MKQTIPQRCKNPLNIRYSRYNHWTGQRGQFKGFCIFVHKDYGYRAALKLLLRYVRDGFNTPESIINRWAPPSENDTKKYVETVCELSGLQADTPIIGFGGLIPLCAAMSVVESGAPAPDWQYLSDLVVKFKLFPYGTEEKECVD